MELSDFDKSDIFDQLNSKFNKSPYNYSLFELKTFLEFFNLQSFEALVIGQDINGADFMRIFANKAYQKFLQTIDVVSLKRLEFWIAILNQYDLAFFKNANNNKLFQNNNKNQEESKQLQIIQDQNEQQEYQLQSRTHAKKNAISSSQVQHIKNFMVECDNQNLIFWNVQQMAKLYQKISKDDLLQIFEKYVFDGLFFIYLVGDPQVSLFLQQQNLKQLVQFSESLNTCKGLQEIQNLSTPTKIPLKSPKKPLVLDIQIYKDSNKDEEDKTQLQTPEKNSRHSSSEFNQLSKTNSYLNSSIDVYGEDSIKDSNDRLHIKNISNSNPKTQTTIIYDSSETGDIVKSLQSQDEQQLSPYFHQYSQVNSRISMKILDQQNNLKLIAEQNQGKFEQNFDLNTYNTNNIINSNNNEQTNNNNDQFNQLGVSDYQFNDDSNKNKQQQFQSSQTLGVSQNLNIFGGLQKQGSIQFDDYNGVSIKNNDNQFANSEIFLNDEQSVRDANNSICLINNNNNNQNQNSSVRERQSYLRQTSTFEEEKRGQEEKKWLEKITSIKQITFPAPQFNPFDFQNINQLKLRIKNLNSSEIKDRIIYSDGCLIGRSKESIYYTEDPSVSREHAFIFFKEEKFYFRDNGSSWGSFFKVLTKRQILQGETIQLGIRIDLKFDSIIIKDGECTITIMCFVPKPCGQVTFKMKNNEKIIIKREKEQEKKNPYFYINKEKNSIYIEDQEKTISSVHSNLIFENGQLCIEDANSVNGTWLRLSNRGQISEPFELKVQDQIRISQYLKLEILSFNSIKKNE